MSSVELGMKLYQEQLQLIITRRARIGVVGLGYVGLPLSLAFCNAGFNVIGLDTNAELVKALNSGNIHIEAINPAKVTEMLDRNLFEVTSDTSRLLNTEVVIICVPTPLNSRGEPDVSAIVSAAETIAICLKPGHLIILESTTYPGTTETVLVPILQRSGLICGETLHVAYSPEREDPGNLIHSVTSIPKLVGGLGLLASELSTSLYETITPKVIQVSDPATAESAKLLENIFRCVNIALVNELKPIFSALGVDIWEVIDAAATKPFGYMAFYPGPGIGGHCIPVDPFYLSWQAKGNGLKSRFIEISGEIIAQLPRIVVDRVALEHDKLTGRGLNATRILIIGAAYKKNVGDIRESPALEIMRLLISRGAEISYYDPHVANLVDDHRLPLLRLESIGWTEEALRSFEFALIITDHDQINYEDLVTHCPLTFDCRNATKGLSAKGNKIIRL